jgi:hypothetical protein
MKSLLSYFLAGFVSAFITFSAWADGSDGSGNILTAPQLTVASDGPITATFLGASQSFPGASDLLTLFYSVSAITETPPANYPLLEGSTSLASTRPAPGTQAQTPPLSVGTNVALVASFGGSAVGMERIISSTASSNAVNAIFAEPPHSALTVIFGFNAGVIETGPDRVLVGFTPFASPTGFGDFPVRISVSNVCVR